MGHCLCIGTPWQYSYVGYWVTGKWKRVRAVHCQFCSFISFDFLVFQSLYNHLFHFIFILAFINRKSCRISSQFSFCWCWSGMIGISLYLFQPCTVQDKVAQIFTFFLTELAQNFLVYMSLSVLYAQ